MMTATPKHKRNIVGGIGYRDKREVRARAKLIQKRLKGSEKEMRACDQAGRRRKVARALEIGALVAQDRTEIAHETGARG